MGKTAKVVIRKYANRRLYDTSASRYVNLEDIAAMIRNGTEVQVIDAKTGQDLTRVTLTQIILEEAGGTLTDLFGQPLRYNGRRIDNRNGIVATNGAAHEMVIENLKPLLDEFGRVPV